MSNDSFIFANNRHRKILLQHLNDPGEGKDWENNDEKEIAYDFNLSWNKSAILKDSYVYVCTAIAEKILHLRNFHHNFSRFFVTINYLLAASNFSSVRSRKFMARWINLEIIDH